MEYKAKVLFFCQVLLIVLLVGCKTEGNFINYESKEHGFSFLYPDSFKEADKEKDRFAFIDKDKDVILFIINKNPLTNDLLTLGKEQAYKDFSTQLTSKENIEKQVKIMRAEKRSWYTYAIDFPEKNVKSIVSGTLCGEKEIVVVLVTKNNDYEENKEYYLEMLRSFKC